MRRAALYTVAIALTGMAGWQTIANAKPAQERQDRENRQAEQAQPQLPDGFDMKDLSQLDNVRGELAKVTEYALTRGDFGKVVAQLAVWNRDRMKDYRNEDYKTLDGVIEQINMDWKQKYGHEFNIKKAENVFNDEFVTVQGVVTNPNAAAMNFPVPAERGAQLASNRQRANEQEGQVDQVVAKDLQESKGVALVRFPGGANLSGLIVSMIEEGHGSWYVALPPSQTAEQIHMQLQNELTYFGQNASQWPADETTAYRMAAHRVFMAIYNVNPPEMRHETR
ncbi:MAG TPA: hypothetical protein VK797_16010 [Tepidisphaeraceae bacterium]|jgi:hypothetical protein|nr:hypothetical protein [Tepidisphaeraceae bacterium]